MALQLPLVGHCQGELVYADLETRHRGDVTVCIFDLHTVGTTGGGTEGEKKDEAWREGGTGIQVFHIINSHYDSGTASAISPDSNTQTPSCCNTESALI